MLNYESVSAIVSRITYKAWEFIVLKKGDGFLLQPQFLAWDHTNPKATEPVWQKCRKWYVSSHSCEAEVVRTVYKAIEAAELHELQEHFKFDGQSIFGPHVSPEDLALVLALGFVGLNERKAGKEDPGSAVRKILENTRKIVTKKGHESPKPRIGHERKSRDRITR